MPNHKIFYQLNIFTVSASLVLMAFLLPPLVGQVKAAGPSLFLVPSSGSYDVDERFTAEVKVDTDGNNVVAVSAYLDFDTTLLHVVSVDTSQSPFDIEAENVVGGNRIKISLGKATPGVNSANALIAKIVFKGKAAGQVKVDFALTSSGQGPSRIILDDGLGTDILASVTNGSYTIGAPVNNLPFGRLDGADATQVTGWAYDPEAGTSPINVHIYIDGTPTANITANLNRPDIVGAEGGQVQDAYHGFDYILPSLSPGIHTIRVYAINYPADTNPELAGSPQTVTIEEPVPPPTDTTPPSIPANLRAQTVSLSQIDLQWDPSTDNVGVMGYKIYRDGTQIATTLGPSYSDTGLQPSATYTYRVSAYDAVGNESTKSTGVLGITEVTPPVISNIQVTSITDKSAVISWATDEPATSQVEYGLGVDADYERRTTFDSTLTTFHAVTLSNLQPSTSYHFRVASMDLAGNPALSGDSIFTTLSSVEPPPVNQPPFGHLDGADATHVIGWAHDPEAGTSPINVHIYIDGTPTANITANLNRPDIVGAGNDQVGDPNHGFDYALGSLSPGTHTIRVYAINYPEDTNPELAGSPKTITIEGVVTYDSGEICLDEGINTPALTEAYSVRLEAEQAITDPGLTMCSVKNGSCQANGWQTVDWMDYGSRYCQGGPDGGSPCTRDSDCSGGGTCDWADIYGFSPKAITNQTYQDEMSGWGILSMNSQYTPPGQGDWFKKRVPNDLVAGNYNLTIRAFGNQSDSEEHLVVSVNGNQTQTSPDVWNKKGTSPDIYAASYTFPRPFQLKAGDVLRFEVPNDSLQLDWYQLDKVDTQLDGGSVTALSKWVTAMTSIETASYQDGETPNYCGRVGYYSVGSSKGVGSITIKTPSLPAAGEYQFTFIYRIGSGGQANEDLAVEIGGKTFNFHDDIELENTNQFEKNSSIRVNLNKGVNEIIFKGTGGDSVHLEAFRIASISIKEPPKAAGPSLFLTPTSGSYNINDQFTVEVRIDTDNNDVVAASAYLDFDTSRLQVLSVDTSNSAFDVEAENIVSGGQIKISLGKATSGVNSANALIAKVVFRAKATGQTKVDFALTSPGQGPSRIILDDALGTDILASVANGIYAVTEPILQPSPIELPYPNGSLLKTADSDKIYLVVNGKKRWLVNPEVFFSYGLDPERVITVEQSVLDQYKERLPIDTPSLPEGTLIRAKGDHRVYIIKPPYKRHIFNPVVFGMYQHLKWENVQEVVQEVVDSYITSNFYRAQGDYRVYAVIEAYIGMRIIKHHLNITVHQFISLGYEWPQVFTVSPEERDYYETGEEVVTD